MVLGNTEFNGDVLPILWGVLGTGNELSEKGLVQVLTNIASKRALPKLSSTDDPLGAYEATPTGDTVTTTYSERSLEVLVAMLYEEFNPADWLELWEVFRSVGDMTNLAMNPTVLQKTLEIYKNKVGTQVTKLFFNGDTLSATDALTRFDGLFKYAAADGNTITVANQGVITKANVIGIVEAVYNAIPAEIYLDESVKIIMDTADYRLLQQANLDAKKTTTGVLSTVVEDLFLNQKIEHISGIGKDNMIATPATTGNDTNLFLGVWVAEESETARIDRIAANSDNWFTRINYKMGMNYRTSEYLVTYQGAVI